MGCYSLTYTYIWGVTVLPVCHRVLHSSFIVIGVTILPDCHGVLQSHLYLHLGCYSLTCLSQGVTFFLYFHWGLQSYLIVVGCYSLTYTYIWGVTVLPDCHGVLHSSLSLVVTILPDCHRVLQSYLYLHMGCYSIT